MSCSISAALGGRARTNTTAAIRINTAAKATSVGVTVSTTVPRRVSEGGGSAFADMSADREIVEGRSELLRGDRPVRRQQGISCRFAAAVHNDPPRIGKLEASF